MKTLIIWLTWLTLAFFCPFESTSYNLEKEYGVMDGGHIEVIGDFLISNTGHPEIEVESIEMVGPKFYEFSGCEKSVCSFNIMHVIPGTYDVTLYGSDGFRVTEREVVE